MCFDAQFSHTNCVILPFTLYHSLYTTPPLAVVPVLSLNEGGGRREAFCYHSEKYTQLCCVTRRCCGHIIAYTNNTVIGQCIGLQRRYKSRCCVRLCATLKRILKRRYCLLIATNQLDFIYEHNILSENAHLVKLSVCFLLAHDIMSYTHIITHQM